MLGTEHPNTSGEVFFDQRRNYVRPRMWLLREWRPRAGLALLLAPIAAAVKVAASGWPAGEVAVASAVVTWAAIGIAVLVEWLVRMVMARGDILARRLQAAVAVEESLNAAIKTRDREMTELRSQRPRLKGEIRQMAVGIGDSSAVVLTLTVAVDNIGSLPTVARGWTIECTLPGKAALGLKLFHSDNVNLGYAQGSQSFTKSHMIYEKTETDPIEVGGSRIGLLLAILPNDLTQAEVAVNGMVCRVGFQDIRGNHYVAVHETGGVPLAAPQYQPGL